MNPRRRRAAFTLIEILVATALTLLIMAATVTLFGTVTEGIAGSRAIIETMDRLRMTSERLSQDLRGVTALPMLPPLRPEQGAGYFEYREGNGIMAPAQDPYLATDTTVGHLDDILMFTCRSTTEPFLGSGGTQSQVAEIAWFVRGTTLYRRVLLVMSTANVPTQVGFYGSYDISVRQIGGTQDVEGGGPTAPTLVANSLADLTKRENRYAHKPKKISTPADALFGFPHSINRWGQLGLPTLRECSYTSGAASWPFPYFQNDNNPDVPVTGVPGAGFSGAPAMDYWTAPYRPVTPNGWSGVDADTGDLSSYLGPRIAEDVILTNVISFDVKAWDPGAPVIAGPAGSGSVLVPGDAGYNTTTPVSYGAYVDLGWMPGYTAGTTRPPSHFFDLGHYTGTGTGSAAIFLPRVYDTWSTHYEHDGINQDGDGLTDEGVDGADNGHAAGANNQWNNSAGGTVYTGGIDDPSEREAPPPYAWPLRGIQIKIRVFEPDSRQIREVTVVQDFLPE